MVATLLGNSVVAFVNGPTWTETKIGDLPLATSVSGVFEVFSVGAEARRARAIRVRDVDGDGDLDLVLAEHEADRVSWFENYLGTGRAWTVHHASDAIGNTAWVDAVDVNHDGVTDIVACGDENIADFVWFERSLVCE